jgi:hypothetical protein
MTNLSRALSLSILAVALAACGSGGGDSANTQTANNTKPQTPAAKPSTDPSASQKLTLTLINMPDDSVKRLYELPYSTVTGITKTIQANDGSSDERTHIEIGGTPTPEAALPKMGKVIYNGLAFNKFTNPTDADLVAGARPGYLSYTIDFDERTGEGEIAGLQLDAGEIRLNKGNLEKIHLDGQEVIGVRSNADMAQASNGPAQQYTDIGDYELGIFGHNADAIAGKIANPTFSIGFGGTRSNK